ADGLAIDGELRATNFELAASALGDDRIVLDDIDIPCVAKKVGGQLSMELSAKSDLGTFAATGGAPLSAWSTAGLMEALTSGSYEANGQLDVARLTQMLPQTLRLREGLQITRGQLKLQLQSEPERSGSQLSGHLTSSDIEAVLDDREIAWRQPLTANFVAHQTTAGLI